MEAEPDQAPTGGEKPTASLRRALLMAASGRFLAVPLHIIGPIIIARLLSPRDFGLFGIAVSVVGLSGSLREFGTTNFLIRLHVLDRLSLGRALAFTGSVSLAIGTTVFLLRGQIGLYFGDARIGQMIGILCVNFLLVPPSIGAVASLQRRMRFGVLNLMQIGTSVVALVVQVGLAVAGFGPFALAFGQIAQAAATLAVLLAIDASAVLVRPVFTGMGEMLRFGAFSAMAGLVGQFGGYATSLILGRRLGPSSVGFFDRGAGLAGQMGDVINSIAQVLFVGISQVRNQPEELARLMLSALANLTAVVWPAYLLVAALARPIIVVLFGARWAPSAPVLQIFCLTGLLVSGGVIYQRMIIAQGRTGRMFAIEAATQGIRFLAVLGLSSFGFVAAAWGTLIALVLGFALYVAAARTYLHAPRAAVVAIYARSLAIALATAAIPWLLAEHDPFGIGAFLLLPLGGGIAAVVWFAIIMLSGHPMAGEVRHIAADGLRLLRRRA